MPGPEGKDLRLSKETQLSAQALLDPQRKNNEVTKHTSVPSGPRVCSVCSVGDKESPIDGEFDANGNQRVEHLVTIELEYIKDRTKVRRGWRYKFHQGRHAMERFICRPCLRGADIMRRDWMRKCAQDSGTRKANHDGFYGDLCS